MVRISTLRPGLLVSLKTEIRGNVSYRQETLDVEHLDEMGALRARWETERTISDPEEHARAIKVRTRCRSLITGVCAMSAFGYLCGEANRETLDRAVAEAVELADEFNATAALSRITVNVLIGRITADDAEAIRAIHGELRDLLEQMSDGLMRLDTDAVRQAASKARAMKTVLSDTAATRVQEAIDVARAAATRMVKAGEQAAKELDRETIAAIVNVRRGFLDVDDAAPVAEPAQVGRGIDLGPMTPEETDALVEEVFAAPAGRAIDL